MLRPSEAVVQKLKEVPVWSEVMTHPLVKSSTKLWALSEIRDVLWAL